MSQSVFRKVVDVLGHEIAGGELGEGDVLNLTQIEARFGVSRTVAREAMRELQSLGMITPRRRVGLIVSAMAEWDVLNPMVIRWRLDGPGRDEQLLSLTDLRSAVEPTAARLAAKDASPTERTRLLELSERLIALGQQGEGDTEEYLQLDVDYHQLLLRASKNEMLIAFEPAIEATLVGRNELGLTPKNPTPMAVDDHRQVALAILDEDEDRAEESSRRIVRIVRSELPLQGREAPRGRVDEPPATSPAEAAAGL